MLPAIVFCRGQDRPQYPQSSVLACAQTHPSGDLLLVELVACLSVLCFQLQNTKARQSVAPWWSVSSMPLENSVQSAQNAPKPNCLPRGSRKRKGLLLLHSSCPTMTLPGTGSLSSTHNLPEIVCIYHFCHGV